MLIALLSVSALADGDAGRESPFSLGAGARGMGMGRAYVALDGDASAAFWNPAAFALLDKTDITAFHTSLFMGTRYDCFSVAYPMYRIGVFSVSAGRIGTDDIEYRDSYNIPGGKFTSAESRLGISYAKDIIYGFSTGVTFNAANQRIGVESGTGYGVDWGVQFRPKQVKNLILGLSLNDLIRPGIKLRSIEDKYQTLTRTGISYSRPFNTRFSAGAALEIDALAGKGSRFHSGIELKYLDQYSLRAGVDDGKASFGAGILYNFIKIDYAYENIDYFGASHRVSLGFTFGKSISKSREEERASIIASEKNIWLNDLNTRRQTDSKNAFAQAESLKADGNYQGALINYQRALAFDSTLTDAGAMSDSMIALIRNKAVSAAGDQKRKELIAQRIGSAMTDYQKGLYNESISKLNLLLEIDPGNQSVTDLLNTVRETLRRQINDRANIARSYQNSSDYVNAIVEWNKLLAIDRNNAEATRQIAALNKQIDADRLIAEAIQSINDRRYTEALQKLRQAREIRPDDKTIASLMAQAGAKSAPATTLEDIKASAANWDKYLKGLGSYQDGDYAEALRIWTDLRNSYPNNSELDNNIEQARQRLAAESKQ